MRTCAWLVIAAAILCGCRGPSAHDRRVLDLTRASYARAKDAYDRGLYDEADTACGFIDRASLKAVQGGDREAVGKEVAELCDLDVRSARQRDLLATARAAVERDDLGRAYGLLEVDRRSLKAECDGATQLLEDARAAGQSERVTMQDLVARVGMDCTDAALGVVARPPPAPGPVAMATETPVHPYAPSRPPPPTDKAGKSATTQATPPGATTKGDHGTKAGAKKRKMTQR